MLFLGILLLLIFQQRTIIFQMVIEPVYDIMLF